ncbi:Zinc finger protein 280D [Dissostichus eleginoides]|uniref:Zinc finger protein 280D n=1 Tax=Dissostichus eleginoides TaxID=100907 RepID=A0AAD9CTR0_DISEL|nr:Zinc finger protein 280D [Dissostichus eleginoides]
MPGWKKNIPACLQPDQEGVSLNPVSSLRRFTLYRSPPEEGLMDALYLPKTMSPDPIKTPDAGSLLLQ